MRLTQADWVRVGALAAGFGAIVSAQLFESFGFGQQQAAHIAAAVGALLAAVALISKVFSTPSPQPGSNYAMIPQGTIPAVGMPTAVPGPGVAVINADTATVQPLSQKVGT